MAGDFGVALAGIHSVGVISWALVWWFSVVRRHSEGFLVLFLDFRKSVTLALGVGGDVPRRIHIRSPYFHKGAAGDMLLLAALSGVHRGSALAQSADDLLIKLGKDLPVGVFRHSGHIEQLGEERDGRLCPLAL